MIRGVDITFDPNIKYSNLSGEESDWKASLRYLDSLGFSLSNLSKGYHLAGRIAELKQESSFAAPIGQLIGPLSRVSQVANLLISAEAFLLLTQEGEFGPNLSSIKEILILAGKGIELSTWFAKIEKLGISYRAIGALSSMGLALAFISPMLSLVIHLRNEGRNAFNGTECYKTSYKVGMALLAIYLFTTAVTLSTYLEVAMLGTNFALSYL